MVKTRVVSSSLLLLLTADLVAAGNRPGSAGGCSGEAPIGLGPRRPGGPLGPDALPGGPGALPGGPDANRTDAGPDALPDGPGSRPGGPDALLGGPAARPGGPGPPQGLGRRFVKEIIVPAKTRALQVTQEDIELCCTGNGDFEFLMRDLDVRGLAVATEEQGYRSIPGDSRWSCRAACRDPANGYDLQPCLEACDCSHGCPTSIDYLTTECKSKCVFTDRVQQDICLEDCNQECSERCTGTFNNYIVPVDIYREGMEILDCYYGDLLGDAQSSCASGKAFWEFTGHTCQVTQGIDFDCECNDPGNCLTEVYDCDYQEFCVSSPPSSAPSRTPTGKGKSTKKNNRRRRVRFS